MVRSYIGLGVSSVLGTAAVGSIPNLSGSASETNIKAKHAEGMENIGKTFPTHGKLAGAGMVLGSLGRLTKKSKKLQGGVL